jgi:hypothetical protein
LARNVKLAKLVSVRKVVLLVQSGPQGHGAYPSGSGRKCRTAIKVRSERQSG